MNWHGSFSRRPKHGGSPENNKKYPFIKHVQIKLPGEPAEPRRLSRLKRAAEAAAQSGYSLSVHAYPHINLCEGIPALAQANLFLDAGGA